MREKATTEHEIQERRQDNAGDGEGWKGRERKRHNRISLRN